MKKIVTLAFFICFSMFAAAQTDGITYQAVIIGPDDLELPGIDVEGNYLPNATIAIRFTILDSGNQIEFQEVQITETDEFGRINLLIGDAEHDYFKEISWDGTPKDLKVEIDFEAGSNFQELSRERLTFLPFAYHRNITATGTLTVDDRTFLNGELQVEGPSTINSSLDVNNGPLSVNNGNATILTGDLTTDGITNLNSVLNVNNGSPTNLSGNLSVGLNTSINGTLEVVGLTTLYGGLQVSGQAAFEDLSSETLVVAQSTDLFGSTNVSGSLVIDGLGEQIRITSDMPDLDANFAQKGNHPLLIDGGRNGIAIEVIEGRDNETNFITFYDQTSTIPWGRIEGETPEEFENNADYVFDQSSLDYDIFDGGVDYAFSLIDGIIAAGALGAALADARPCAGLGACIVSPGPAMIAAAVAQVAIEAGKITTSIIAIDRATTAKNTYDNNKLSLQGVTYASGAGDYAEYLLRENSSETMTYGDIVGVIGGKISKNTENAERVMVVSYQPIVLGNMPETSKEEDYEKVAFMGQVPVKIFGKVNIGDYIIPSGKNDGIGIAITPDKITLENIKKIVGIAWSNHESLVGFGMVNVAVGLNTNDHNPIIEKLEDKVDRQALVIDQLKYELASLTDRISNIEKGTTSIQIDPDQTEDPYSPRPYEIVDNGHGETIYFQLTREDIIEGIDLAEKQMRDGGIDIENNEFWKKMKTDSSFKEAFIKKLQEKFDRVMHYHKEIDSKDRH